MKAFNVLMFLIAFNLSLDLLVLIVGQASAPAGGNVSLGIDVLGIFRGDAAGIVLGLIIAIGAVSVTALGTSLSKPIAVVVGAFGSFYLLMMASSMAVLYNLKIETHHLIPWEVIGIFVIFNGIVFIIGMFQLVSGGWRSAQ